MSVQPLVERAQQLPGPQGHAIGFFNTKADCDAFIQQLNAAGFSDSTLAVLDGADGIHLLNRMMAGSLWGETAEDIVRQATIELSYGHYALVIESPDREQAMSLATLSANEGGHAFYYFGEYTDERLTKCPC